MRTDEKFERVVSEVSTDHAGDLDHRQSEVLEEMGFELDETRNIISHPDDAEATLEANDADRDLYRVRRLKRVYDQSTAVVDLLSRVSPGFGRYSAEATTMGLSRSG